MNTFNLQTKNNKKILSLGAESAGNFSLFYDNKLMFSDNFGDLLLEDNFQKYEKNLLDVLEYKKIIPNIILSDLHPLFKTTALGKKLSKKFKSQFIQVQHHFAHIFSGFGDNLVANNIFLSPAVFLGLACDGTGLGLDNNIWGGEIFKVSGKNIERIGHLENQTLLGADLAIEEPARMLISILAKFLKKETVFNYVKKYYSENQFELLYNQLQQNFNCQKTSSTGRILDATSLLLGFCENKRSYKHEPINLLEKNSTISFNFEPQISYNKKNKQYILLTTPLFKYLIDNIEKDKGHLASTAQTYIAKGLFEILTKTISEKKKPPIFFTGGMANNKIISSYLKPRGIIFNKTIPPGDAGLSFGQIIYYLSTNPGN